MFCNNQKKNATGGLCGVYVCSIENGFRYSFVPFRHFWFQKHKIYLCLSWLFVNFYCCSTTGFSMFLFFLCFLWMYCAQLFWYLQLTAYGSSDFLASTTIIFIQFQCFLRFFTFIFYRIITVITTFTFCWVSVFSNVLHKCRLFSLVLLIRIKENKVLFKFTRQISVLRQIFNVMSRWLVKKNSLNSIYFFLLWLLEDLTFISFNIHIIELQEVWCKIPY